MGLPPFPYTLVPYPISGLTKLQIPQPSAYNWGLGNNVPVNTDNYQNMRIMLAVLSFKKWEKLSMLVFSNYAKNYASTIYKSLVEGLSSGHPLDEE